jgi:hypothetical protein
MPCASGMQRPAATIASLITAPPNLVLHNYYCYLNMKAQRREQYSAQDTATLAALQQQLARARAAAAAEASCTLHSLDAALVREGVVPPPTLGVHPIAPLLPLQYSITRGSAVVDSIKGSTASSFEQLLEQQQLAEHAQTATTAAAAAAAVERERARVYSEELAAAAAAAAATKEAELLERQGVAAASAENTAAGAAERLHLAAAMATRLQSAARGWVGRKRARGMWLGLQCIADLYVYL